MRAEGQFKYFVNGEETPHSELSSRIDIDTTTVTTEGLNIFYKTKKKPIVYQQIDESYIRKAESIKPLIDELRGVKHNKAKAPLDTLQTIQFPKALQLLALASAFGHNKYRETDKDFLNYKRVEGGSKNYFEAAARHNTERNDKDDESGLNHVIHVAWNMMAALELWAEENNINIKEFSKEYLENLHMSK